MRVIVTGGAGFIGSALCRHLVRNTSWRVQNLDALTYAGNLASLAQLADDPRYSFVRGDICDRSLVDKVLADFQPDGIIHLAAESHVDRSIDGPAAFITTNIVGTYTLLEATRAYWKSLPIERQRLFRFHQVSTDEVYGSLGSEGLFTEETAYAPNSPYSASKASADHLVRAWHHTYGLPVVMSNCSNNYGPYHFPEKLIPLMILNALEGKPLPVYGNGQQVRDWLYVDDHARALNVIFEKGRVGEKYNVGGNAERRNLEVVQAICRIMDVHHPGGAPHERLITYVSDRPGHDLRYAIDANKLKSELGWEPSETFDSGLEKTVRWYLDNRAWWSDIHSGKYRGERLGLGKVDSPRA